MVDAPATNSPRTSRRSRAEETDAPRPSALPHPLTSFIGREGDIKAVLAMLARDEVRLLTFTGPGGIGKTRLALRVAQSLDTYPDGIWFVPLASITDPALVGPAIVSAIDAMAIGRESADDILVRSLRDCRAMLVLDNFEQVLDATPLVTKLLEECSELKVLITSRSGLNVSGEHRYAVPALGGTGPPAERETVRLFAERARARQPEFALTEHTVSDVARLCERLDGLPLGIELAAARITMLSPRELLDRLDARLALLDDGARDQPGRLRSLRASIAWSYDLLLPGEQVLLRRLGVFAGPWTLDAAEAVIYAPDEPREIEVLNGVGALVEKSLIRHQVGADGNSQYQLLETVREFAAELLDASDEADAVRRRLTGYLAGIADNLVLGWFQPVGMESWFRLELHSADLFSALARSEAQGDVEVLICLAAPLATARMRGWMGQLQDQVDRAVTMGRAAGSPTLGRALLSLAHFVHSAGDEAKALKLSLEGVALLEAQEDREYLIIGYTECALIAQRDDAMVQAKFYHLRALDAVRALDDCAWAPLAESAVFINLGNNAVQRGEFAEAKAWFEQAIEVQVSLGFEPGTGHLSASHVLAGLGDVSRGEGNHPDALKHFQRAIALSRQVGDYRAVIYAIGGVAATLACSGQWRLAARLFGASQQLHRRANIDFILETWDRQRALGLPEPWFRADEPFESGRYIRDALWADAPPPFPPIPNPAEAERLWAKGRTMTFDEVADLALAASIGTPGPAGEYSHLLSAREVHVLRLLVEGMTDSEIAAALFIRRRTAASHLRHIYDKLGVSNRAEAAATAVRNGIA